MNKETALKTWQEVSVAHAGPTITADLVVAFAESITQKERDRKREAGLVKVEEWLHPDDAERLRKYAAKLRKARARSEA